MTTEKEGQMFLNVKGVSCNSKPRSDGRYQGYVTNEDGTKTYYYGRTREELVVKLQEAYKEAIKTKNKIKKQKKDIPKFGEYVNTWIELYKKPNLKATSFQSLLCSLSAAIQTFGETRIDIISTDDVQRLLLSIQSERLRGISKLYLNQVFEKALKQGLIKINPCAAVEIKNHKSQHVSALTVDEQTKVVIAVTGTTYELLINFLLCTGTRIGEALALRKSDVDAKNCTVSISKNVVFINGKRIEQDTPKTEAGRRILPIPAKICESLLKIETDLLFPFTYNAVSCALKRVKKNTGVKVTLHVLRHTYATRLEEAGISPKVKQYLLGHSSLEMTQNTYTDVQQGYLNTLSDTIRKLFDT